MTAKGKITAIAPWFGGKRTLAPVIAEQLGPHNYYFEGCAGSMAVLFAKQPASIEMVCDVHGLVTNLAKVVQDKVAAAVLFERLQRTMYCDKIFAGSKAWLDAYERGDQPPLESGLQHVNGASVDAAYHYFICSWMGRNGVAGTKRSNYQIATRWTPRGGAGGLRFANAVDSIPAWCERLRRVHVLNRDVFDVLPQVEDQPGAALYCDPPYFRSTRAEGGGCKYLHDWGDAEHQRLADQLRRFERARVIVSYYDCPEARALYPGWTVLDCSRHKHLHVQNKRMQSRKAAPEILLINGPIRGNGERTLFDDS